MLDFLKQILTNKKFYLSVGGFIALFGLIALLLNEVVMPAYTNYNEGVTVPDVTEISLAEAKDLLTSHGLRYEVTDRRSNAAFPKDYVIDQSPTPAEIVKPNRKVYLTVNAESHPTVIVPDVVNLSLRNAKIQLQNYGLKWGTISYESSRFKHSVLRQSVPAGTEVEKGMVVDLVVSDGLGEKLVDVPEIIGLKLAEAQRMIRQAGLRVGQFRFQPSDKVPPNTILSYTPNKNKLVEGEALTLILSERADDGEQSESGVIIDTTFVQEPDSTGRNNN